MTAVVFLAEFGTAMHSVVATASSSRGRTEVGPNQGSKWQNPHEYRNLDSSSSSEKVCKTFMRQIDPGPRLQTPQQLTLSRRQIDPAMVWTVDFYFRPCRLELPHPPNRMHEDPKTAASAMEPAQSATGGAESSRRSSFAMRAVNAIRLAAQYHCDANLYPSFVKTALASGLPRNWTNVPASFWSPLVITTAAG